MVANKNDFLKYNLQDLFMHACMCMCESLGCVQLFATPWAVACQAPLSIGFPRQEYCSELPFPPPGNLPDPGIEPVSPAMAGRFFTTEPSFYHFPS